MPFSSTASIISTDLDNMLRGLYRDNSDSAVTGTLVETTLKSVSIPANTIGPTGGLHIIISGTTGGVAGGKTMTLKFGGQVVSTIVLSAGNAVAWFMDVWIFNTATNAQRRRNVQSTDATPPGTTIGYGTTSLDTTQNQTLLVTGTLGNIADSITMTMFDVFLVQIN